MLKVQSFQKNKPNKKTFLNCFTIKNENIFFTFLPNNVI